MFELDKILEDIGHLTRSLDMPRRIELCQQAILMISRDGQAELWAAVKHELAKSLLRNPLGDKANNFEQALRHAQETLDIYTPRANPEQWAMTQNIMATAYRERIHGNNIRNIERAIFHYKQALDVYTRDAFPADWAIIQNNLANAYADRFLGERAENIELSIHHYEQALEVRTRQDFPADWAMTQNNLALAFADRIRGDQSENLERALHHCTQSLEVFSRETFPTDWANSQSILADLFTDRICGEQSENYERAFHHCEQALQIYSRQANPEEWAMAQRSLANAYWYRIHGERAENIEKSIHHYELALEVYTHQSFPVDWASTQNNLANAYSDRIRGDRAENIERAIHYFKQNLEIYTRRAFPPDWAMTQNNLANAYWERLFGAKRENIEQAIYHHKQALEIYTRQAFPLDWAMTLNNLALAYWKRMFGEKTENIERAIHYYKQVLDVYTRQAFPFDWAMTNNNLALAYADRISGRKEENIEQAIYHYEESLEVRLKQSSPIDWALTHNNLAEAYSIRIRGDRAKNIARVVYHCEQALEVRTVQAHPAWCCETALVLGNLGFENKDWALAARGFVLALSAQEMLIQSASMRASKTVELKEMQNIPAKTAYAYAHLEQLQKAVECIETGRAQLLREELERQRRDLKRLPALGFDDLYQAYVNATQQFDLLISEVDSDNRHSNWQSQLEQIQTELNNIENTIRRDVGKEHLEYRYFMHSLPFKDILNQSQRNPLVYFVVTSVGGLGLMVTKHGVKALHLPKLTEENLRAHLYGSTNDKKLDGYLGSYMAWRNNPLDEDTRESWITRLDAITSWMWDAGMGEIVDEVKKQSNEVVLIPTGQLSLLPLHAAWTEDTSQPTGRRYALDELNISYAPSAHALWMARMAADRPVESVLAVDNPDGTLSFSSDEVQAVLEGFIQIQHLAGKKASTAAVKVGMQRANVLHFSTHGVAGWQEAEQSRLKLADGDLSLPDIFGLGLDHARLAVLSACETGVPGLDLIDEMIGLPSGMMQAGVPGVIGSLWAVNDMSTAMLMARFYSLWREEGKQPLEALRQAQIWLRDSTTAQKKELFKHFVDTRAVHMSADTAQAFYQHIGWDDADERVFESPFYWAAFTYTGV